jgi:hypothetical protein
MDMRIIRRPSAFAAVSELRTGMDAILAQLKETPVKPPYQWVGVGVHPVPQKSFAMLLDERTGQQILVCQGGLIPGTSFEVVEITRNSVKIRMAAAIGIVERPKPEKIGKPESKALSESISKNSLTIEKNKVMVEPRLAFSNTAFRPRIRSSP